MPVVPWRGPPPFGGRCTVIVGARRPSAKALHDPVPSNHTGPAKYISLIERWDSDEVVLEQVPDPSE